MIITLARRLMMALFTVYLAMSPLFSADAGEPTKAQKLRSEMSQGELRTIRGELKKMHSTNRWPKAQQDRYLAACEKQKAQEPSINHRMCECTMEVMMEKYVTFGEYAKDLVDTGAKPDEQVAGMTGMCLVAYGS